MDELIFLKAERQGLKNNRQYKFLKKKKVCESLSN